MQTINNIKTVTLSMGTTPATVRSDIAPEVHILADILRVFSGNKTIELAKILHICFPQFCGYSQ
ncbi:MAG: hypothetical protein IPK11_15720 [Ignavibacteria bacterium]|nr:hypothetical protein [Ignavibacteria bacterium]